METILVIGGLWVLFWVAKQVYKGFFPDTSHRPRPLPRSGTARPAPRPDTYRPKPRGGTGIRFPDQGKGAGSGGAPRAESLEGLHDAFTGAALNPTLGLHQCTNCKVYYHAESVTVLREENSGRCVACGTAAIVSLTKAQAQASPGRDYDPAVVTLANYRQHIDRVITFEGKVRSVKVSRRGLDYAVMFEDASWTKGLKLVFFRGAVGKVGGPSFIKSLDGRHVRVRGLLIRHPRFGPEIVISERSMILEHK